MEEALKEKLMEALEEVLDPEIGIDIVNLGLVYGIDMDEDGIVEVRMTLTSMGCPLAPQITEQVRYVLQDFPEVNAVNVEFVWTPPWDRSMMSRYAKIALGIHE